MSVGLAHLPCPSQPGSAEGYYPCAAMELRPEASQVAIATSHAPVWYAASDWSAVLDNFV